MKDWSGGRGFEGFVERLVENSIPPYLIGLERNTMNPFRAREASKKESPTTTSDKTSPNTNVSGEAATATITNETSDNSENPWDHCEKIEVDQITKDSNCWRRLEDELIRYLTEQRSIGVTPTDKMMQDYSRVVIYGDPDPWDWTMADNQTWLDAFKLEHGVANNEEIPQCEFNSTREVPVSAPYWIKGGLKTNAAKRVSSHSGPCPSDGSVGHRNSTSSLPGIAERGCPLAHVSSNGTSYHGGTPITPAENEVYNFSGPPGMAVPLDVGAMDLDFDAIDFNQLDLNHFGEMEFDESLSSSVPVENIGMGGVGQQQVPFIPASTQPSGPIDFGMGYGRTMAMHGQKGLEAPVNPFITTPEDEPEMSLEAFDQLTGYVGSFR